MLLIPIENIGEQGNKAGIEHSFLTAPIAQARLERFTVCESPNRRSRGTGSWLLRCSPPSRFLCIWKSRWLLPTDCGWNLRL